MSTPLIRSIDALEKSLDLLKKSAAAQVGVPSRPTIVNSAISIAMLADLIGRAILAIRHQPGGPTVYQHLEIIPNLKAVLTDLHNAHFAGADLTFPLDPQ